MARTYKKVRYSPSSKERKHTPITAASGVEQAFKFLEGRWKLVILFHRTGGSDDSKLIAEVTLAGT